MSIVFSTPEFPEDHILGGFVLPVDFAPTFVVPHFRKHDSNQAFVQSLDTSYRIEGFAGFDLNDVPDTLLVAAPRPVSRRVGDQGIVGVRLDRRRLIWGRRETVKMELAAWMEDRQLPPFFRIETAQFLGETQALQSAIEDAASRLGNSRWRLRELEYAKLGQIEERRYASPFFFLIVGLSSQNESTLAGFENAIASWKEVIECHMVLGGADFLLKVTASNTRQQNDFIKKVHNLKEVQKVQVLPAIRTSIDRAIESVDDDGEER